MSKKLFAVFLGGRAPKCNTELHDVVFVVGETIAETYDQLMDKWFGDLTDIHLDSWMELQIVDGYKVSLSKKKSEQKEKLFFLNLGVYVDGEFAELHANKFIVADNKQTAKAIGKMALSSKWTNKPHTDDLYAVDDCLEIGMIDGLNIVLEKTEETAQMQPVNGYHIIPKAIVENYLARNLKRAG